MKRNKSIKIELKRIILFGCFFLFLGGVGNTFAEKIKKERDRWRLGYESVTEVKEGELDANGNFIVTNIWLTCTGGGNDKCRPTSIANSDYELDAFGAQFNTLEKIIGQNIMVLGENQIENGDQNGSHTETHNFVNIETGFSYYRTISFSWNTDPLGKVISELYISDPF